MSSEEGVGVSHGNLEYFGPFDHPCQARSDCYSIFLSIKAAIHTDRLTLRLVDYVLAVPHHDYRWRDLVSLRIWMV